MVSRRDFLKLAGFGAGAGLLHACGAALTPTPLPLPVSTSVPVSTPLLVSTSLPVPTSLPVSTSVPRSTPRPVPTPAAPTPGSTVSYAGRKLCFVLWDHELERYSYQPRNLKHPVPMTCPLYSGATNTLTSDWIDYWQAILHLCNPHVKEAEFELAWRSLVAGDRAFTNGTGPGSGRFAIHSLTCGGATHEMVTGEPEKGGHVRIYTLNIRRNPPPMPSTPDEIDMTRHFFATTGSNTQFPDGSYAVYGFPQFENCIVPLISNADTDMIDIERIRTVTRLQNPYHTWQSQMPRVGQHKR